VKGKKGKEQVSKEGFLNVVEMSAHGLHFLPLMKVIEAKPLPATQREEGVKGTQE